MVIIYTVRVKCQQQMMQWIGYLRVLPMRSFLYHLLMMIKNRRKNIMRSWTTYLNYPLPLRVIIIQVTEERVSKWLILNKQLDLHLVTVHRNRNCSHNNNNVTNLQVPTKGIYLRHYQRRCHLFPRNRKYFVSSIFY